MFDKDLNNLNEKYCFTVYSARASIISYGSSSRIPKSVEALKGGKMDKFIKSLPNQFNTKLDLLDIISGRDKDKE